MSATRIGATTETTDDRPILLECTGLSGGYGPVVVIHDLELRIHAGEVVALLGPNGAGKTTTLLTLAGELRPVTGHVSFLGTPTTAPMHRRAKQGLGFVTEERSVIRDLSVADNLKLGNVDPTRACSMFPELQPLLRRPAGLLSGGEQQILTLARALARRPRVLLADELSLGLAPMVVERLLGAIRRTADEEGVGVLFVEQHVRQALAIADYVCVMQRGRIAMAGTPTEIEARLGDVKSAYLSEVEAGD